MRKIALLLGLTICAANAGIYKRVMPDGQVIFTDKPDVNATPFQLTPVAATIDSLSHSTASQNSANKHNTPPPPPKIIKLQIQSPLDGATIRNNSGELKVSGHLLGSTSGVFELLLNGTVIQTQSSPHFSVTGVTRGTHNIQIVLKNKTGKLIALSSINTIHMHRASALLPAN